MPNIYINNIKAISLFLFLSATLTLSGQCPYEISVKKDLPILGVGIAAQVTGFILATNVDPLSPEALAELNVNDINSFDRKVVSNYSTNARSFSDVFLYGSYALPALLLFKNDVRQNWSKLAVMGSEVILLNGALTTLSKVLVKRPRPFTYNPDAPLEEKIKKGARFSFFSGHTSAISSATFFAAKVFSDYHPDSKWKPVIWSTAAILPAITGYLRVKGGKHFPTDVMTGYAVGALVGILIPQMHKKKKKDQKVGLSIYSGGNTVGLTLSW